MNSITVKNFDEVIVFLSENDNVNFHPINEDELYLTGNKKGTIVSEYVSSGFCREKFENFLFYHENIYCKSNTNKNPFLQKFKEKDKKQTGRKVICSCGDTICYSSTTKHYQSKKHTNVTDDKSFTEIEL